jgi:hypothetical protein
MNFEDDPCPIPGPGLRLKDLSGPFQRDAAGLSPSFFGTLAACAVSYSVEAAGRCFMRDSGVVGQCTV